MKKRLAASLLAGVMAASMAMPAMASSSGGGAIPSNTGGTEVWAGITLFDPDAQIKVEVPTLFAFVVNGTVNAAVVGGVTAGDILLPNVKVKVDTPSTGTPGVGAVYSIQTVGDGTMPFVNYSTSLQDDGAGGTIRKGLEVKINGNIKNEGTDESRNYWKHVGSSETSAVSADFKKYNILIENQSFSTVAAGGLEMAAGITLNAPEIDPVGDGSNANLDTTTNHAIIGESFFATFDVKVGGERTQYRQVEQSAKIGTIIWTISAQQSADVDTAPNNDYLDQ